MKNFNVEVTEKVVIVLEKVRKDVLFACEYGMMHAERNENAQQVEQWKDEIRLIRDLDYSELHTIMIDQQYNRIV